MKNVLCLGLLLVAAVCSTGQVFAQGMTATTQQVADAKAAAKAVRDAYEAKEDAIFDAYTDTTTDTQNAIDNAEAYFAGHPSWTNGAAKIADLYAKKATLASVYSDHQGDMNSPSTTYYNRITTETSWYITWDYHSTYDPLSFRDSSYLIYNAAQAQTGGTGAQRFQIVTNNDATAKGAMQAMYDYTLNSITFDIIPACDDCYTSITNSQADR